MAGNTEVAHAPRRREEIRIPSIGDRIARTRAGITITGKVHYADGLQVLVKWDDGSSNSLRVGRDRFEIVPDTRTPLPPDEEGGAVDDALSREQKAASGRERVESRRGPASR